MLNKSCRRWRAKGSPHNGLVLLCLVTERQFKYSFSDFHTLLMVSDKLEENIETYH